jgi:hypothetical protein
MPSVEFCHATAFFPTAAERHVEAKLSGTALRAYRAAGYEDEQKVTV